MAVAVELAAVTDDAGIRRLLRDNPVPGRITLSYEREPNYWQGCRVMGETCDVVVARAGDEVVGVACRSVRRVYMNGREQRIGYLGQLRVDPRYRGRWLVGRGFRLMRDLDAADSVPAYLVSIVGGNEEAERALTSRNKGQFPRFRQVAEVATLAFPISRRGKHTSHPHRGQSYEIMRFLDEHGPRRQGFPIVQSLDQPPRFDDFIVIRRSGLPAGVAVLWDQSAYKQTVVRGYGGWLRHAASLHNLLAAINGQPRLPRPGDPLHCGYGAFLSVAGDDPCVLGELLEALIERAAQRGMDYVLIGFDRRDPLLAAAAPFRHFIYPSKLYLAQWPEQGDRLDPIDDRPWHAAIATY